MAEINRRAGYLQISTNGKNLECAGDFDLVLDGAKREALAGPDGVFQGYKTTYIVASISGSVRDSRTLKARDLLDMTDATIVAKLATNKKIVFEKAFYSGDRKLSTGEGTWTFEVSAESATEISR
jgi:hypothetical protein